MRLDAQCGCGAEIHLDSGGHGNDVADGRLGRMFLEWMKEHQPCRTARQEPSVFKRVFGSDS